jgi:tetratricopeptide (TPR) repeat protein
MRERAALAQSFLKVKDSFFKLTDVQSWDDVRSVLKAHPELLTPAVDAYMTFLYQENKKEMTPDIVKRFQLELAMLQRLRERGVDAGIAEWIAEGHGLAFGPSTVLEEMQEALKRPVTIENATAMIQYFEKSLEYISRDLHPTIRAFVLLRLGQAYADTAIGDRAEDVERAIIYLEQGLADVTRDTDPTMWAYSQFFLGQAYQRRVSLPEEMEELGNQNRAIDCFEAALEVFTREQYPEQHKMVLLRLARLRTGYSLPEPHWSEMQEEVLGWYEELVGMTDRTNNPGEWARVQNELGRAYQERLAGPPTQNLQQAILLHQTALEEIAPNTADYAETLANIGDAHASTVWRNEADHRAQAINYYRQALGIFTRSNDWASLYEVHEKLGNLAFEVRDWETAARSYLEALAINRDYYKLAITRETRRLVSDMILSIPAMAAYALAQLGRTAQAVETLEQFRTRWLAQTLDLATADLAHLDANDRNLFEQIRKEIAALQAEERLPEDTPNPRPFVQVASELRQAFQRLDEFQKRVMVQHPILFKELDFAAIQRACPSANPIVYLLTTFHGSLALIVTSEGDPCPVWGSLSLRDATKWIVSYESPGEPIVGDYFKNQVILDSLPDTLETMTKSLGEGLMQPLAHALHTLGVSQVTLIPTGTLSAYPLHATPITAQGNRYFVDDFQVAYAPSAYGLVSARESIQKRANQSSRWVGIGVTELAEVELVSAAEKIPAQEKRLVTNTQATRSQALANLNQATLIHLGCHALSMFFGDPFESEFRLFNNETILLRDLLQPELVNLDALAVIILSACQTALPADFMHFQEEVMGFPTVLLSRGVPVVVGTMWKVTDISTTLLIVHFYECLQSGDSIQQALQNAQVWLRHLTRDSICEFT